MTIVTAIRVKATTGHAIDSLKPWAMHAGIYGVVVNLVLLFAVSAMTRQTVKTQDADYLDVAGTPS